jgi:hypothetical protein
MIRWNLLTTVFLIATLNNVAWSMQDTTGKKAEVASTGTVAQVEKDSATGEDSISSKDGERSTPDVNTTDGDEVSGIEVDPDEAKAAIENYQKMTQSSEVDLPWDYSPYKVLIWLISDSPDISVSTIEQPLRKFLDRDYSAIWRVSIAKAPRAVANAAHRNMAGMDYNSITAADPVLAVKRTHKDAVRIRVAENVARYVNKVYGTRGRIEEVKWRAALLGDETVSGVGPRMEVVDGDAVAVRELWADEATEAVLVSRGAARTLDEPEAKVVLPKLADLVSRSVESYDKIFVVKLQTNEVPAQVSVLEMDTLMRHFGPVAKMQSGSRHTLTQRGLNNKKSR